MQTKTKRLTESAMLIALAVVLELVGRKVSAKLGRPIKAVATDKSAGNLKNEQMEQLLQFGRAHSDIIKIKE